MLFLSTDPLARAFSWTSPYNFAENTPISSIYLYGLQQANVVATIEIGEAEIKVKSAEGLETLKTIGTEISLSFLEDVAATYNKAASAGAKLPNFPSFMGQALNLAQIIGSAQKADAAREKGDKETELHEFAKASGASISAMAAFGGPLISALGTAAGTIISESGNPNSVMNTNNGQLAEGRELSLYQSKSHPLQVAGRESRANLFVIKYSIIKVLTVTRAGEVTVYRPGDTKYGLVDWWETKVNQADYLKTDTWKNADIEVDVSYEVVSEEVRKRK